MKVLVVYHYLALYRQPVFEKLMQSKDFDFYFACDVIAPNDIKLVAPDFFRENHHRLKNKWFFKKILWQKGLFSLCYKNDYDAIIFLGDPYFLSTWICSFFLKARNIKCIFWSHGFVRGSSVKDKIKIFLYNLSDGKGVV